MKFFFSYLWRSPLIRLAIMWFIIAVLGIAVFSWRLTGMRAELIQTNKKLEINIEAIHQIESSQKKEKKTEIDQILEEINQYRPSVEELLDFVKAVETIASNNKIYLFFHTIKTNVTKAKTNEDFVAYKAGFETTLDQAQSFLEEFEKLPYATDIESIDITKNEEGSYIFKLIFILYTKIK